MERLSDCMTTQAHLYSWLLSPKKPQKLKSEEEELVYSVQSFLWCSQWVLTPSAVCTPVRACVCMCVSVLSLMCTVIGLCMSPALSLQWHLDGCETAVPAAVPLGIYWLYTHTQILLHVTPHPLSFHNIPPHAIPRPNPSSTSLSLFEGKYLGILRCLWIYLNVFCVVMWIVCLWDWVHVSVSVHLNISTETQKP